MQAPIKQMSKILVTGLMIALPATLKAQQNPADAGQYWARVNLSAPVAKLHPAPDPVISRKVDIGAFFEVGKYPNSFEQSNRITGVDIQNYITANPTLQAAVVAKLGGAFTIPAGGINVNGKTQLNYGLTGGYFVTPRYQLVTEVGAFSARMVSTFPVAVGATVYPHDGSFKTDLNGFTFMGGLRVYINEHRIRPFCELDLGVLGTTGKINESMIRDLPLGMGNEFKNLYYMQKFGVGIRAKLAKDLAFNAAVREMSAFNRNQKSLFTMMLYTSFVISLK